ncbi:hypothetical protein SAMN05444144_101376 [Flavobacterium akiainvivens]|nr:hypothetical protein SAMN05444144_101376 [Flavobacterium akiainvivens]
MCGAPLPWWTEQISEDDKEEISTNLPDEKGDDEKC